jgi:hypothetical protein
MPRRGFGTCGLNLGHSGKYRVRLGTDKPRGADYQKQDSGQQHSVFGDVLAFVVRKEVTLMNGLINFPPNARICLAVACPWGG